MLFQVGWHSADFPLTNSCLRSTTGEWKVEQSANQLAIEVQLVSGK